MKKTICDKCNGKGSIEIDKELNKWGKFSIVKSCSKCNGCGKLDWVEVIMGVKNPESNVERIIFNSKKGWD